MPLPPIAVDVAPASKDYELVQMLLDACSRAASPVKCVTAESVDTGSVSALALVVWLPQAEGVRIQVGAKRGEQEGRWVNRQIAFDAEDEEGERWTAAGFVVGTLASRFLDVPTEPAPAAETKAPIQEAPRASPEPQAQEPAESESESESESTSESVSRTPAWLGLEAAALAGPLLDEGPWRVGGMLGLVYQGENWPVFLAGAVRLSGRPEDQGVALRATEGEAGVGVSLGAGARWAVNARAAFALQRLYARFNGDLSNGPQTHWVVGGRARVDFCWRFNDAWSGFFSPGLSVWSHKTAFVVGSNAVGEQPSVLPEALLGLSFAIPLSE
ncbi:MAG TPA: hypothetical protein VFU02_09340 [Polyangiaceae bacterium]|nr:hypothetical protein [Polyangiaceae bacterium]